MNTQRAARISTLAFATLALPLALLAAPDDASVGTTIKKAFAERFPQEKIVHVVSTPIEGLYEVFTGAGIFYSDKAGDYIVSGTLMDARTKQDLTSTRVDELNKIDFQTLPFDRAIKVVKGDGSRQLAVFSDPDCPYCKALEKELASITNVTVYTFLYPLPIHPDAAAKAQSIWCAPDRAATWTQWMVDGKEPESRTCDGDPTDGLVELGKKLNVSGTPTLYFVSGKRVAGAMRAKDLSETLDKVQQQTADSASPAKSGT